MGWRNAYEGGDPRQRNLSLLTDEQTIAVQKTDVDELERAVRTMFDGPCRDSYMSAARQHG